MRQNAFEFFFEHAGYGYNPDTESPFAGRVSCATDLARAEYLAWDQGYTFHWSVDPYTYSSDWSDELPAYQVWDCIMRSGSGNVVSSLGGIDFGPDGTPWDGYYKRVIEAELAMEQVL
jgi:hypothetical protein